MHRCSEGMEVNTHNIHVCSTAEKLYWNLSFRSPDRLPDLCQKRKLRTCRPWPRIWESARLNTRENNRTYREDTSPAIIRDMDKCIMCRRCEMMCNDVQTVGVLSAVNRGFMSVVAPAFEMNLDHSRLYLLRTMCCCLPNRCLNRSGSYQPGYPCIG